ncbi:hypothetical protein [Paenibacillus silvae]|nr:MULTISPECIES: hypothetical protein [Paenibacillus]MCK6077103.1 hypothetical protein [Paenibacillus silvae]MCK6151301.1 hypothetical protein [Paenibacillus silvae]MCK6269789.1 hypothetical protein [Paenibacillus silvae]
MNGTSSKEQIKRTAALQLAPLSTIGEAIPLLELRLFIYNDEAFICE